MGNIEILAPAGSMESIYAAVRCGADAVYVGGSRFSARANATNFTDDELSEAVDYCHLHNVRVYQAINTLFFDNELEEVLKTAKRSAEIGVDAFILQDIGAAMMIKQAVPDMKLNCSTQMTVHTKEGALLAKEMGYSRVVVSRELSVPQIKDICTAGIEVETFIHGALCMSVSGQCYMSAMIGSRSADRGLCAQACRLPFSAVKGRERYDLSLKDLSGPEHINELRNAGVCSLKIEGRMKRAEYVAAAVTACRSAADGKAPDMETLRAVFSRSGFTDGYLTGKLGADMFGTRQKEDVVSADAVFPQLRELYRKETKAVRADFYAEIKEGRPAKLEIITDGIRAAVTGDVPQKAMNRPTDKESLEKQLSKLGDTPYELGSVTADIDEGLILPASQLNALRRTAVEEADKLRLAAKRKKHTFGEAEINITKKHGHTKKTLRAEIMTAEQLDGITEDIELIIMPLDEVLKNTDKCRPFSDRLILSLPRFTADEEKLCQKLETAKSAGFKRILCTNFAHIRIGREAKLEMHGGFGLNVTNSLTARELAKLGLADFTASFEMKLGQINALASDIPYGIIAYGRLPLMLTRNCPVKQAVGGCKNCTGGLTDRTGRFFPVRCDGTASEVLNSEVLVMSDRLDEAEVSFVQLNFNDETPEKIKHIISAYKNYRKLDEEKMTRGLYYRGII